MTGGKAITGATGATGARLTSANLRVNTQAQAKQYRTDPVVQRVLSSDDTDAGAEDDGHAPRHPQPLISWWFAIGLLTAMTALAGVTAEFLVDSIDGLVATGNVSREFVGLILLPVIGEWRYQCPVLDPIVLDLVPNPVLHPPSSNHDPQSSILNPFPRNQKTASSL
jgi:hypothetical protein